MLLVLTAGHAGAQGTAPTAAGGAAAAPPKAAACAACHGADGKPILPAYPVIAGQTSRYLYLQLRDFQEGRRKNDLMTPMVAGMSRDEMRELSDYFAKQKPPPQKFAVVADKAKLGKAKAEETLCTMCHLGGFAGQNEIPRVAGQNYDYIIKQLADFKARRRTNDAGSMTSVANTLSDQDIENLAQYLVGL
ncbi:c-type cytochrome [Variovorax sp. J22R133]|uniref:c-type cytochrome n=1 Tax=Variovorax brevis TaxID=3053503 RepID=UPI002578D195|nr:c-type cytochrome [Variovorax sp. J22R133]MDM0113117.1 c-type cytochrome [Variovorax sp. J22R133]